MCDAPAEGIQGTSSCGSQRGLPTQLPSCPESRHFQGSCAWHLKEPVKRRSRHHKGQTKPSGTLLPQFGLSLAIWTSGRDATEIARSFLIAPYSSGDKPFYIQILATSSLHQSSPLAQAGLCNHSQIPCKRVTLSIQGCSCYWLRNRSTKCQAAKTCIGGLLIRLEGIAQDRS